MPALMRFPAEAEWRWRLAALALPVLALAGFAATERYLLSGRLGLPLDDSWIHLVLARQLVLGEGMSYPAGELLPASTAPLWTALLSLLWLCPGPLLAWVKVAGAALLLVSVDLAFRLGRRLGLSPPLAAAAGAAVGTTDWLVWSSLSGMEVCLATALTLLGLLWHLEEAESPGAPARSLGVFAIATLARPEGALLLGLALAERAWRWHEFGSRMERRALLRTTLVGLGAASAVLAPPALWSYVVFGSILPTTFAAKVTPGGLGLPNGKVLLEALELWVRSQAILTCGAVAGAVALLRSPERRHRAALLLPAWLVALPVAYAMLSSGDVPLLGNFGRYLFPLLPVLAVLGVWGLAPLLASLQVGSVAGPARRWLAVGLLVLLGAVGLGALVRGAALFDQSVLNVEESNCRLARWLRPRLPPEALVAVNDIGVFGWELPNRLLDLGGLVTPELPRAIRARRAAGVAPREAVMEFLAARRPDYVITFASPRILFGRDPEHFPPLLRLHLDDNITMAASDLVLYATPWTTHRLRQIDEAP